MDEVREAHLTAGLRRVKSRDPILYDLRPGGVMTGDDWLIDAEGRHEWMADCL
jgi:hypothetical protein